MVNIIPRKEVIIMSVESIQNTAQVSGQYMIRAKREAQSASQAQESQQAIQNQNVQNESRAAEADTYDKENPAGVFGEKAEGVYSVSHDESGNLRVDYTPKSESTEESQAVTESESPKSNAAPQPSSAGSSSETSSAGSDDELEELQRQKNEIQQQLNREQDENVKAQLRTQLQNIEAQIIQLKLS